MEADSGGETEAGTTQRDVVRHGVAQIPVSFSVTAKWLKKLAGYAKLDKISVQYFDVETSELKLSEMYVTGYKAKLKKDTSYKGVLYSAHSHLFQPQSSHTNTVCYL